MSDSADAHPTGPEQLGPDAIRMDGRRVLVTGAARGIGAAVAELFARAGAHLVLVDRLEGELAATVDRITALEGAAPVESGDESHTPAFGGVPVRIVGDVRDPDVVDLALASASDSFGGLDVVVNNAGGGFHAAFDAVSTNGEAALIAENFTQVTSVIRRSLAVMTSGPASEPAQGRMAPGTPPRRCRGKAIVNITSIEAHRAGPGFAVYSAMKAALENLTRTLALELAPRGIRVNAVAPDMIPTPGDAELSEAAAALSDPTGLPTPMGHVGMPVDVAAAVLFLASDLARFVTGTTIHVDGGTHAASGWRRGRDDRWLL
ncbi:MAG: SDR family NAD(P)-dependent oxidoreductase [Microthrixaceae bacterium]